MILSNDSIYQIQEVINLAEKQITELSGSNCKLILHFSEIPTRAEEEEIQAVKETTASIFNIPVFQIEGDRRFPEIHIPRLMCWKVIRHYRPGTTFKQIGIAFNGRDHSSITVGITRLNALLDTEEDTMNKYQQLLAACKKHFITH